MFPGPAAPAPGPATPSPAPASAPGFAPPPAWGPKPGIGAPAPSITPAAPPAPPETVTAPIAILDKSTPIPGLNFPTVHDPDSFTGKVLVVIKPQQPLDPKDVEEITRKVQAGMGLLLVGDGGFDNTNINPLSKNFSVEFNNDIISSVDETGTTNYTPFMYSMPHPISEQLQYFQVDKSCSLKLGDWFKQVLLFSAKESFSDADWDGSWEQGEYVGSCAVMAKYDAEMCRAVFIGDAIMFERNGEQDQRLLNAVYKWLKKET